MRTEVALAFYVFRKSMLCFAALVSLSAFGSGTVTNCTEANFRAALAGGGTVVFACSGTLALSNTIVVSTNTLILGSGYNVTIDGSNSVQLFQVNTNVTLEIHDLILANGASIGASGVDGSSQPVSGSPGFGGGILNGGGTVTLIGCTLTNLTAVGGNGGTTLFANPTAGGNGYGAAICNLGGILNLTNCAFYGNQARGGVGSTYASFGSSGGNCGQAWGGAIYSDGGMVGLSHVLFSGNLASGGSSSSCFGGNAAGGALFSRNSQLIVTGSSLMGNGALGGAGAGSGDGLGGALYLSADSTAIFQHCSFVTNGANGAYSGDAWFSAGIGQGGAIYNLGSAQIVNSLFCSNSCLGGSGGGLPLGQGGAVFSTNVLWIDSCTLSGNRAVGGSGSSYHFWQFRGGTGDGGAVWSSGDLRATNSTFVANSAAGGTDFGLLDLSARPGANGGAVRLAGGAGILMNVTVSGNRADASGDFPGTGPASGGGLSSTNATVTIRNSIIANTGFGGDVWGPLIDAGYNICSDSTANFSGTGSLNNVNPLLGPLADNGGPIPTMLLLSGSPALDAVPAGFPPVDQRGVMRPQGVAADIGAVEVDNKPPTVSITSPTAGQRCSNSVFTVTGKAADNVSVAAVYYQVNGQGWNMATTSDNWADWSALVYLTPGTNLLDTYSIDTSSNSSAVAHVTFEYVATDELKISATGLGTISPNYSNSWLEIGQRYSIKASPASGFVFTNWVVLTNGLSETITNGSTVQFTMASNLSLQLNFIDVSRPTLSISSPMSGQRLASPLATVLGTASDNWKVRGVWCQLDGGAWAEAATTNAWTNWAATLELSKGTNTFLAVAQDLGGNYSITKTLSLISSNTFDLQLRFSAAQPFTINGANLVLEASPGLNGHIQVSTNLVDWLTLTNFHATNLLMNFRDQGAVSQPERFYRAVIP